MVALEDELFFVLHSGEILHHARLSPVKPTGRLDPAETERLFAATRRVLADWTDRLRREFANAFPEHVTAFRPGMAMHGRYREPCAVCGTPVQRIVRRESESNDWPRTLEELELPRKGTR